MPDYLLDSGILIRLLRNRPGYQELFGRLSDEGQLYISAFSRVEVIRGMRPGEQEKTQQLLNALLTHPLDTETADLAGEWIRAWSAQGMTISGPDAVIAASAYRCGAVLVTTNPNHFPMTEIAVLSADEEGNCGPSAAPTKRPVRY
jgi:predicted nucleic acid-binding protein